MDPAAPGPAQPPARSRRGRLGAELSGALALGLCALAVVVLALQGVAWVRDTPGPGLAAVGGHVLAAVLAVLTQRLADRRSGWTQAGAVLGVLVIAGLTLWLFWLA